MSQLVTAASEVTFDLPATSGTARHDRYKPREKAHVQTHSTDSSQSARFLSGSTRPSGKTGKPCVVCDREGHRVNDCTKFKSLNVDERWKVVHQKNLCRTCLNNHGKWPCKSGQGCNVPDCRNKHHTLLHSSPPSPPSTVASNVCMSTESTYTIFHVLPVELYNKDLKVTVSSLFWMRALRSN